MGAEAPSAAGLVIDASALAAVLFHEPAAPAVARFVSACSWSVTTFLLEFEVHNVALVKTRRGEVSFADAERALASAVYPLARPVRMERALRLAEDLGLTAYDGAYLELARTLDVPLLTLDGELLRAAPQHCISPL